MTALPVSLGPSLSSSFTSVEKATAEEEEVEEEDECREVPTYEEPPLSEPHTGQQVLTGLT